MQEKIDMLYDIVLELDARECSCNSIDDRLWKYGWKELCEEAIRLLNEIK